MAKRFEAEFDVESESGRHEIEIHGRLKYLVIGGLFIVVSAIAGIEIVKTGQIRLLSFSAGLFVFGIVILYVWTDLGKAGKDPGISQVPRRYMGLIGGYLFFYVGLVFILVTVFFGSQMGTLPEMVYVFRGLGIVCLFIGLPLLISYFRFRLSGISPKEIEIREKRLFTLIGAVVAICTILGGFAAGILVAVYTGESIGYYISFGLLGIGIFIGGIFFILSKTDKSET
jgi:hypothetical protein